MKCKYWYGSIAPLVLFLLIPTGVAQADKTSSSHGFKLSQINQKPQVDLKQGLVRRHQGHCKRWKRVCHGRRCLDWRRYGGYRSKYHRRCYSCSKYSHRHRARRHFSTCSRNSVRRAQARGYHCRSYPRYSRSSYRRYCARWGRSDCRWVCVRR